MKLVICGSRTVCDEEMPSALTARGTTIPHTRRNPEINILRVIHALEKLGWRPTEIVSGCARGGDRVGELVAKRMGLPIKRFPADWNTHGKRAGYLRNAEMVAYADAVLALWDGKSKGTKHTIDIARQAGKPAHVVEMGGMLP